MALRVGYGRLLDAVVSKVVLGAASGPPAWREDAKTAMATTNRRLGLGGVVPRTFGHVL